MRLKQLLRISSNHRFIKVFGTWRDGWRGKTSRYCVAYCGAAVYKYTQNTKIDSSNILMFHGTFFYEHSFFSLHNLKTSQLFPLLFLIIAERYQCMCKESTVFVNSAKRVPIWIYTAKSLSKM